LRAVPDGGIRTPMIHVVAGLLRSYLHHVSSSSGCITDLPLTEPPPHAVTLRPVQKCEPAWAWVRRDSSLGSSRGVGHGT
jgi:hypothetical protein